MGFLSKAIKSIDKVTGGFFDDWSGREQQEDANAKAMQSWQLANDYNHPINQMERLKSAGLNPLLVYGSGSVSGNTTSAPSLTGGGVATGTQSLFSGLNNVLQLAQGKANLDNTYAQTQASAAAAGASGAQAANLASQTAYNEKRNEFAEKSMIADIDYKQAMTKKLKEETRGASATSDMLESEASLFGSVGGSKGASAGASALRTIGNIVSHMGGRR